MTATVIIEAMNGFAEDKDQAKLIRTSVILPTLSRSEAVVLDFKEIQYATQSFVHALIGEALQRYGERALELVEFKHCSEAVRSAVELVVDYSLGGFVESHGA
ncbi:MAG TPA: DUF4325 domain-containing protein [Thermoanaerobaculia bacterium]|jgi:hypothetical protein|nr:DUF4325 domain-containing protein [Thermoanaerobaculia bacterium]